MVYEGVLNGRYVELKSCTEDDAEFTREIRKDPDFVKFLPVIDNSIEQQQTWIRQQRKKEGDYFFVVWNKKGNRIGTISIYNILENHAEGGRLAIKGENPFQGIEAQLLVYQFAYGVLGLSYIDGYIRADNERAIRFSRSFGDIQSPPEMDEDGEMVVRIRNERQKFAEAEKKLALMLYRKCDK